MILGARVISPPSRNNSIYLSQINEMISLVRNPFRELMDSQPILLCKKEETLFQTA